MRPGMSNAPEQLQPPQQPALSGASSSFPAASSSGAARLYLPLQAIAPKENLPCKLSPGSSEHPTCVPKAACAYSDCFEKHPMRLHELLVIVYFLLMYQPGSIKHCMGGEDLHLTGSLSACSDFSSLKNHMMDSGATISVRPTSSTYRQSPACRTHRQPPLTVRLPLSRWHKNYYSSFKH